MILDKLLEFSDNQTATNGDSTNTVDTGAADRGIGDVTSMAVVVTVQTKLVGTLTVAIHDSQNGSSFAEVSSGTFAPAAAAGSQLVLKLPSELRRYIKLRYNGGTGGKVSAHAVMDYDRVRAFPAA